MSRKQINENDSWVNPGAPAERSFIGFHRANVAHIDPTDPDVAQNNDPVFTGSNVKTYERTVNRMGYDHDDDYNHYDNFRAWRDGQLAAIRQFSTGQKAALPFDAGSAKHDDWVRGFTSVSRMFEQVEQEQDQLDEDLSITGDYGSNKNRIARAAEKRGKTPEEVRTLARSAMKNAKAARGKRPMSQDQKNARLRALRGLDESIQAPETHTTKDGHTFLRQGPTLVQLTHRGQVINRVISTDYNQTIEHWNRIKNEKGSYPSSYSYDQPGTTSESALDWITRPSVAYKAMKRGGRQDRYMGRGNYFRKATVALDNLNRELESRHKKHREGLAGAFDQLTTSTKKLGNAIDHTDIGGLFAAKLASNISGKSHKDEYKNVIRLRQAHGIAVNDHKDPRNKALVYHPLIKQAKMLKKMNSVERGVGQMSKTLGSDLKAQNDARQKKSAAERKKRLKAAKQGY